MYTGPSGPIVAQIVIIHFRNRERHLNRIRILSQRRVSGREERIRTYMRVPYRPKSAAPNM